MAKVNFLEVIRQVGMDIALQVLAEEVDRIRDHVRAQEPHWVTPDSIAKEDKPNG